MSARFFAVVPRKILRRWDELALQQIVERALELEDRNAELESRCRWAEESADMWQQISEREREGHTVGLTQDGQVVIMDEVRA